MHMMGDPSFALFVAFGFGLAVAAAVAFVWVAGIVWAYSDAKRRHRPAWAIALLAGFPPIWPLGLLLWFCFRLPLPTYPSPRHHPVDDPGYSAAG